jgi:hypothetical protein
MGQFQRVVQRGKEAKHKSSATLDVTTTMSPNFIKAIGE